MSKSVSRQGGPAEQTTPQPEVWERLDQATRDRVIELFAYSAYKFVTAQHDAETKENCDVSSREDAESHGGAHI